MIFTKRCLIYGLTYILSTLHAFLKIVRHAASSYLTLGAFLYANEDYRVLYCIPVNVRYLARKQLNWSCYFHLLLAIKLMLLSGKTNGMCFVLLIPTTFKYLSEV